MRRCTPTPKGGFSLDLHVLGMPPALILSQDQTLQLNRSFFPNTQAHYLVFKEQAFPQEQFVLLVYIVAIYFLLSRGFFFTIP